MAHPPDTVEMLEAKVAALSNFAHGVSHDLKAPLRHIVTYSEMLNELYAGKLDENGRKFISRLTVNASRAQRLIDRLLQYAESDEAGIPPMVTDLQAAAFSALEGLDEYVSETGGSVKTGTLPRAVARAQDVSAIFDILLENALTYRRSGAPEIAISGEVKGNIAEIAVADNGIGVSEEFRETIFLPFKRLHSRDEIEGSGLGLAIARRLVERNGGQLGMRPNVPAGAIFYFTLPAAL